MFIGIIFAKPTAARLSNTRNTTAFLRPPVTGLTACCWKNCPSQVLLACCKYRNAGCNIISMTNRQRFRAKWRSLRKKARLTLECDELWSFSGHKGNQQWVWLALDRQTRRIVGCHVSHRDESGAKALWVSLPPVCGLLYGLLGSLRVCFAGYTPPGGRKGDRAD